MQGCQHCKRLFVAVDKVVACRPFVEKPHIYHLKCLMLKAEHELLVSVHVNQRGLVHVQNSCSDCRIKTQIY